MEYCLATNGVIYNPQKLANSYSFLSCSTHWYYLRVQVKMLDGENNKKSKELEDLQARVARDEERDEEARKESFGLKQKIVATEASKEQALKEVRWPISYLHGVIPHSWFVVLLQNSLLTRKLAEMDEEFRLRERDYLGQLAEGNSMEKRLKEDQRNLLNKLDNLDDELAENKLKLSAAEGRVTGLENELVKLEG